MKRENVNYFLTGVVALGSLALLMVALFIITGRSGATDEYVVRYRNVAGLAFGTPVFYQGYRIGQIESISPERDAEATRFRVDFTVQDGWQIPQDSVAQLMSSGLLSDVFISIREGEAKTFLEPGSEIPGREAADLFGAMGEIDKAVELVDKLNASATSLNQILSPANRGHVDSLLAESSAAASNVRTLTADLIETRKQLNSILGELDATVKENRPEIQQAMADLRFTLDSMAQRIDAITYNLESASRHFDEFSRQIRKEPNRLIFSPKADNLPGDK